MFCKANNFYLISNETIDDTFLWKDGICMTHLNCFSLKSDSHPPKKIICFNESPLKMGRNAFYFILKVLFVLKIFKFLHFHIYQIASFVPGILFRLYCYYKWWGDGIGGGRLIYKIVGGGIGGRYYLAIFVFVFLTCTFALCSLLSSVSFLSD